MTKTTIQLKKETWKKLVRYKLNLDAQDYDEVLQRMFKIIEKLKLAGEMK